ncbi:MAG: DUF4411 family protein [Dictyoglomaceae bacterium]
MPRQQELFQVSTFCIDTSTLINITRYSGYPRDVFPTIWDKLETMVREGVLISHIEVYNEIKEGEDMICKWCKRNRYMFKDIDECQMKEFEAIKGKYEIDYWSKETNRSVPWADPWLIALSICENAILVTDESNKPNHIPYIAKYFNIRCLNLIDFFREIQIKF